MSSSDIFHGFSVQLMLILTNMLIMAALLYIKLIIHHIVDFSGAPRNLTIFVFYKCSSYSSNINFQIVGGHMIKSFIYTHILVLGYH